MNNGREVVGEGNFLLWEGRRSSACAAECRSSTPSAAPCSMKSETASRSAEGVCNRRTQSPSARLRRAPGGPATQERCPQGMLGLHDRMARKHSVWSVGKSGRLCASSPGRVKSLPSATALRRHISNALGRIISNAQAANETLPGASDDDGCHLCGWEKRRLCMASVRNGGWSAAVRHRRAGKSKWRFLCGAKRQRRLRNEVEA